MLCQHGRSHHQSSPGSPVIAAFPREERAKRSIEISAYVCLSVCQFVNKHIFKTTYPNFTKFLCVLHMAVAQFWRSHDTLSISGFVDDVMIGGFSPTSKNDTAKNIASY